MESFDDEPEAPPPPLVNPHAHAAAATTSAASVGIATAAPPAVALSPDEEAERLVMAWAQGKNIVLMLATMGHIYPRAAGKNAASLDGSAPTSAVRREYLRSVRMIHPDKTSSAGLPAAEVLLCQKLFTALTDAYQYHQERETLGLMGLS